MVHKFKDITKCYRNSDRQTEDRQTDRDLYESWISCWPQWNVWRRSLPPVLSIAQQTLPAYTDDQICWLAALLPDLSFPEVLYPKQVCHCPWWLAASSFPPHWFLAGSVWKAHIFTCTVTNMLQPLWWKYEYWLNFFLNIFPTYFLKLKYWPHHLTYKTTATITEEIVLKTKAKKQKRSTHTTIKCFTPCNKSSRDWHFKKEHFHKQ